MAWEDPRLWETGSNGDTIANLLNDEVSAQLEETAPAKVTTKGDLVAATGANALARLAVGTDGHFLVADSTQTAGVKWASLPSHSH